MVQPEKVMQELIDSIRTTKEYNQYQSLLESVKRKPELYARIEHLQKFFILPKNYMTQNGVINIHNSVHSCSESFDYNGFKWYDLLFSRRKWKEGYYERESTSETNNN